MVMARERTKVAANEILREGLIAPIASIGPWECATGFNRCVVLHKSEEVIIALPGFSVPVRIHLRSLTLK